MKKSDVERVAIYVSDKTDGTDGLNYKVFDYDDYALDFAIELVNLQKTFPFVKIVLLKKADEEDLEAYSTDYN
jgi:hypothetical protein